VARRLVPLLCVRLAGRSPHAGYDRHQPPFCRTYPAVGKGGAFKSVPSAAFLQPGMV